ncbi:hypothetical protein [Actinoplanes sp. NPDC049118]|uniref:hypothetical protein n=1 Tax=Actinoplanes sp. NPDC049118 TaxID=3155769 RepID=UPI0034112C30
MRSVDIIMAARAEALFTSDLPTGSRPDPADTERAIRDAVHTYGGIRGCAAQMAYGYGDNPEAAAHRMRWARSVVAANYPRRRPTPSLGSRRSGSGSYAVRRPPVVLGVAPTAKVA